MENNYYIIFKNLNKIQCLTCKKFISGSNSYNIKRHYLNVHKKILDTKEFLISENGEQCEEPPCKKLCNKNPFRYVDKNKFLKSCVGLVTVKNLPFRLFDDNEFFKVIISPCENKFGTCINSKNIVSLVSSSSTIIQNIIKNRLKSKLISIKLDIATRMDKSVLGINIQYIQDFKIFINTIGMIQLYKQHTAAYIKDEVVKCLKKYDIDISQIYSNTTDNGANVIKASKMLQEEQAEEIFEQQNENTDQCDEQIHSSIASVFSVVRCAAHTIQLAANDVIKNLKEIAECREVIKTLRRLVRSSETDVRMPLLDNATRWNSTFQMMQSLLNLRNQIESGFLQVLPSKDRNSNINWNFVEEFVIAFNPLAKCTLQLQTEQYILGDFYRDWLNCEIELEDICEVNQFARDLLTAMGTRKILLLNNDALVAGLYLDPRFNYQNSILLSEEQKSRAMMHLMKTYELTKQLKGADELSQPEILNNSSDSINLVSPNTTSSSYSKLELRVAEMDCLPPQEIVSIKQKLIGFGNNKRVSFDTDILKYWKNSNFDGELKNLAQVALAVPATQVSVERAFSALSLILTKWRSKLNSATINDLLLTKLNYQEITHSSVDLSCFSNSIDE